MKRSIRIITLILALVIIIGSIFVIRSCSAPPKYEEIEARFKQLMESSKSVNIVLFGEGLEVYPRVYVHDTEVFVDQAADKTYYYHVIEDEALGTVYGYRHTDLLYYAAFAEQVSGKEHVYLDESGNYYYEIEYDAADKEKEVSSFEDKESGETYHFYVIEDETYGKVYEYRRQTTKYAVGSKEEKTDSEALYTHNGYFYYSVDYAEPQYEFYYTAADPANYDFVRLDSEYRTVDDIKALAETVYSTGYTRSLYSSLFDGVASGDLVLNARYSEYTRDGVTMLTQSNTYEPLFTEERVYMFDTAEILYWESSRNSVRISIDSYLPSATDKIQNMTISLVLQNGQWFLDSPTF